MAEKRCILDQRKTCDDCGECDRCDLDPGKKCDNCGKCVETGYDYNGIEIFDILHEEDRGDSD